MVWFEVKLAACVVVLHVARPSQSSVFCLSVVLPWSLGCGIPRALARIRAGLATCVCVLILAARILPRIERSRFPPITTGRAEPPTCASLEMVNSYWASAEMECSLAGNGISRQQVSSSDTRKSLFSTLCPTPLDCETSPSLWIIPGDYTAVCKATLQELRVGFVCSQTRNTLPGIVW